MVLDNSNFEAMAKKFPKVNIAITPKAALQRYAISRYLFVISLGFFGYTFIVGPRIYFPYSLVPKGTSYLAKPDYMTNSAVFYEKNIRNQINNL